MSKFIRKSKINKFSEADFDTREYIDLPEQTEEEDEDEELLSIEAEISRLNAKRAARQKMLSQRTGGEKQKYNEEYFMQALKPNKYNQSSIKSMRDLSADNQTIIRESAINRDEYAVDNGDNYRSYFKYGSQAGSIFASNPGILEEIMEEKAEKMKNSIIAHKAHELRQSEKQAERLLREKRASKALRGKVNPNDLHAGNINRSVSYEEDVDNAFGQLNIESLEQIEAARKRMMQANCNRSKAIKSRHIVQNDNSWQDMENQRQRSLQDIYDNSRIAEYLEGYDDEIE
jgi:hypothetical protein